MQKELEDMKRRKYTSLLMILCMVIAIAMCPARVLAAEAELTFGSNWYEQSSGSEFHIGAYITADESIGDYHVEIKYDNLRMEFVSGAENVDTENGIITLEGNERKSTIKFWLKFCAISGGDASIEFINATVSDYEITTYGNAPITISGEDTAAEIEAELAIQQEEENAQEFDPLEETENGAQVQQNAQEMQGESGQQDISVQDGVAEDSVIHDGSSNGEKNSILFNVFFVAMMAVILVSIVTVSVVWTVVKRSQKRGQAKQKQDNIDNTKKDNKHKDNKNKEIKKLDEIKKSKDLPVEDLGVDELNNMMENLKTEVQNLMYESEIQEKRGAEPVIQVCDVTMEFHLSSVNPSGLKEYLIQLIKREVKYRRLFALYHVSFNVYKGEIVGIIGTNGSGKSTLLKIVSGALKPTSGHVEVDRRKIQLLTLGTGFDMELTAKENVFLNGSIIGYSREFLESHYDEIVEFAELQDFMDEKVKNFSSGMVSRLGFAIATAGEAAEILILDEVLSVGDEFFRKKSLKRVKEMIHGGSTVLMVSHGMDTIVDNCTKCVWIEKGELRMIGEPRKVCESYRKLNKDVEG